MEATLVEKTRIRYLSDGELYQQATGFVTDFLVEHSVIENKQMRGLWEFSRSWDELSSFVRHQQGRDWGELGRSRKAHYGLFYRELDKHLKGLQQKAEAEFGSTDLGKKEKKRRKDFYAGLLAQEFVQHVTTEMLLQDSIRRRNES